MARFWEFAHLSDNMRGIRNLDRVPRAGNLYIGGLRALYEDEPDELRRAGITHILTILDFDVEDVPRLRGYTRKKIQADDYPSQNLLVHFPETNAFIDTVLGEQRGSDESAAHAGDGRGNVQAASEGPGIIVHCAMGVSRSATIVCAYLMYKFHLTADQALSRLRESRRHVRPNAGFMAQLQVYERMLAAPDQAAAQAIYDKWLARHTQDFGQPKL